MDKELAVARTDADADIRIPTATEAYSDDTETETDIDIDTDSHTLEHPNSLELSRIETYRLQQKTTVGSTRGPQPREIWLPMGAGKEYPPLLPDPEGFVVEFDGAGDPMHPYNWSLTRRCVLPDLRCRTRLIVTV
jgi:DHA1 family multidrug resistance protein-like MFS transporter